MAEPGAKTTCIGGSTRFMRDTDRKIFSRKTVKVSTYRGNGNGTKEETKTAPALKNKEKKNESWREQRSGGSSFLDNWRHVPLKSNSMSALKLNVTNVVRMNNEKTKTPAPAASTVSSNLSKSLRSSITQIRD